MASEEKSLGQKLWGLFVEEVPSIKTDTPPKPLVADVPQAAPTNMPSSESTKFTQHFTQLVEKQNTVSTDYIRFIQTATNLMTMGLSEAQAYTAAWTSFKTLGSVSDVQVIIQQSQQFQQVLEQDKVAFMKDADQSLQQKVSGLQQDYQKKQAENQKIQAEIAALEQKMAENTRAIAEASGQIESLKEKITQSKQQYLTAFETFVNDFKQQSQKIQQYLLPNSSK